MFDLHTHIIPGIDDGADNLDISRAMLELAVSHGTEGLVVTPHVVEGRWLPEWDEIVAGCELLRKVSEESGYTLSIYPGAEVALSMDILSRITGPGPYCINGGSYLLTELPALEIPPYTEDFFFTLQARGITPILAHPERNPMVARNLERLEEWVQRGVLLQINAPSLNGRLGKEVAATAEYLVTCGLAHVIGSDAHGVKSRRPILSEAAQKLQDLVGEAGFQRICRENPMKIIANETVEPMLAVQVSTSKKSGGWFGRWFSGKK